MLAITVGTEVHFTISLLQNRFSYAYLKKLLYPEHFYVQFMNNGHLYVWVKKCSLYVNISGDTELYDSCPVWGVFGPCDASSGYLYIRWDRDKLFYN
jgi:hypothetical protein